MENLESLRNEIDGIDKEMANLFEKRLDVVRNVAEIKQKNGMDVTNLSREQAMLCRNANYVKEEYKNFYIDFFKNIVHVSKKFQKNLNGKKEITVKKSALKEVGKLFDLERKVLIVSDTKVPKEYVNAVSSAAKEPYFFIFKSGEDSKSADTLFEIFKILVLNNFTRTDCIVAVGGGVAGDIVGLAASLYLRGIDWYFVPTTTLAAVDAAIGGKTAIDFAGVKNVIGTFNAATGVLIDSETLKTLPERDFNAGLIEAVKLAIISDKELLGLIEKKDIDKIIEKSVALKERIITADFKENSLRKMLNFGHTVGHAIEAQKSGYRHGECVAAGMLYVSFGEAKTILEEIFKVLKMPEILLNDSDKAGVRELIKKDKKHSGNCLTAVFCEKIGEFRFEKMTTEEFLKRVNL